NDRRAGPNGTHSVLWSVTCLCEDDIDLVVRAVVGATRGLAQLIGSATPEEARAEMTALLRDLVESPLRRPAPMAATVSVWNEGLIPKVALAVYEERILPIGHLDPQRLMVLADALEEAGCAEPAVLGHLRGPGPHVRGCWVVDRVTGRE